jgi:CheY-like chemotaxis protein
LLDAFREIGEIDPGFPRPRRDPRHARRSLYRQHQTLAAATGGQGLSLYRQHQDRVDLNLPDRTSAEVYAELRNISPVGLIALFTGYVNEQTLPPGESALIIEKPVTLEKLSHSVRMALGESAPVG